MTTAAKEDDGGVRWRTAVEDEGGGRRRRTKAEDEGGGPGRWRMRTMVDEDDGG